MIAGTTRRRTFTFTFSPRAGSGTARRCRTRASAIHDIAPAAVALTLPDREVLGIAHDQRPVLALAVEHRIAHCEAEIAALRHLTFHRMPYQRALLSRRSKRFGDCARPRDELTWTGED